MNGEASSDFMKRVSACMSTVCPTILKLMSLTVARSESALALLARFLSAVFWAGDLVVSPGTAFLTVVSAAAALRGWLVCVTSLSQVYWGSAFEISYMRCDQR